ncbi:DUF354 domain-containing protein [Candidatus Poribacteria bacterium]|nr:DUF354 domain-containing protein [Candidatus Poribacteria bacterium]
MYHRFENQLFDELLQWLIKNDNVLVILLPRTNEQREVFLKNHYPNTIIPPKVLDGPNLLFHSDLAISAGGTMNREAVVLGTPVYTVFAGEIPAVDNYLIKMGKMLRIQNIADFQKIKVEKKVNGNFRFSDQSSLEKILEFILDFSGK